MDNGIYKLPTKVTILRKHELVAKLLGEGHSIGTVATMLNMTEGRVTQLLRKAKFFGGA